MTGDRKIILEPIIPVSLRGGKVILNDRHSVLVQTFEVVGNGLVYRNLIGDRWISYPLSKCTLRLVNKQ